MSVPKIEIVAGGVRFSVRSRSATGLHLCLFDEEGERETDCFTFDRHPDGLFSVFVPGVGAGTRYGLRAEGPWDPARGLWFDPDKLLMHPLATRIDRPWRHDERLAAPRGEGGDTAPLVPKAIVEDLREQTPLPPSFRDGGLIYELNVRGFSKLHPEIPPAERGRLAALRSPEAIAHFRRLGVSAVELMPVVAWIDERHLPARGLSNAWGYNPVTLMALDPRLAPNGIADLRAVTDALREENIGVILDIVLNHTGESDEQGGILSFRGLDNPTWYRHEPGNPGRLVNDTGCGNTLRCDHPDVRENIVATLRHFVLEGGVDGFRFDLAPILGRTATGFDAQAATLQAILDDPVLSDRVLVAEPWDVGPGGYRLGQFPARFLEWNDRYRDGVRRFWRGDRGMTGEFATRIAGSSDVFAGPATRSVSFIAAHDGFTLADLVSYEHRHNEANGEENRDGHGENLSWNNGVEGPSTDPLVGDARRADIKALLSTLFMTKGTILLCAGDEFGRTQRGNNNAYAQDNETTWLDWEGRDRDIENFAFRLAELRTSLEMLADPAWYSGTPKAGDLLDAEWLGVSGNPLTSEEWQQPDLDRFQLVLATGMAAEPRLAILFNRSQEEGRFELRPRDGYEWLYLAKRASHADVTSRSVAVALEVAAD